MLCSYIVVMGRKDYCIILKESGEKMDLKKTIRNFQESDGFFISFARDLISVATAVLIFSIISYLIFGMWTPMVAVESGSMEPHMNIGDIVFIQNIERTSVITKADAPSDYVSFKDNGDVILYRPYGRADVTPIIHRAMYFVQAGEPMWEGGPLAPHDGYITKGDNEKTNRIYDQQGQISYLTPVKEEWIIGVARYRIPYIGKIRLMLPF